VPRHASHCVTPVGDPPQLHSCRGLALGAGALPLGGVGPLTRPRQPASVRPTTSNQLSARMPGSAINLNTTHSWQKAGSAALCGPSPVRRQGLSGRRSEMGSIWLSPPPFAASAPWRRLRQRWLRG
jgi:hypothetical protein